MSDTQVLKKIIRCFASESLAQLEQDDFNLNEVGIDSVSTMDIILEMEDTFQITISETYLTQEYLKTFSGLAAILEKLCEKK